MRRRRRTIAAGTIVQVHHGGHCGHSAVGRVSNLRIESGTMGQFRNSERAQRKRIFEEMEKGGRLEARVGFEPTRGGFADLSLKPLGYRASTELV